MTAKDIFILRKQGSIEEAYEAARQLYASDKGPMAAAAMFWTAVDILSKRKGEGRTDEAERIWLALERLFPNVPDQEGWVGKAMQRCQRMLGKPVTTMTTNEKEDKHTEMGRWGEEVALLYLYKKGYDIVERDWHSGHRDIDLIVRQGLTVVFVEVKTRRSRDFSDPLAAIDHRKLGNLQRAINHYVRSHRIEHYRFDIVTVVGELHSPAPDVRHYEDINIMEMTGNPSYKQGRN